jgi:tRNA pseudouridine55 synthase
MKKVQRRRQTDLVDGLLLLNKPTGLTSNQALQKVKRLLNASKAGHTGSLDPAATGMLPLCFGEATKVCAFLLNADKTYRVTAKLGTATDTTDADGQEIAHADVPDLSFEDWSTILGQFMGESTQIPPMYSALKKDGKRLYELARQGQTVEREPRPIRIDAIDLLEASGNRLVFTVHCSKGTYIRTLVEDVAKKAGTVAHTARLHRETVGHFKSGDMLDLSEVEHVAAEGRELLRQRLLPPDIALAGLPALHIDADAGSKFCGGQPVMAAPTDEMKGLARVYGGENEFLGVGEQAADGLLAPRRVFRTAGNGA